MKITRECSYRIELYIFLSLANKYAAHPSSGGEDFNSSVTLSILLLPLLKQEPLQEISCSSKNLSSSQEV